MLFIWKKNEKKKKQGRKKEEGRKEERKKKKGTRGEHKKPPAYWPLLLAWTKEVMKIKISYNYLGQKWQVYNIGEGALQSWAHGRCS